MIPTPTRILLSTSPADFRKSIDGLAALVQVQMRESPLSGTMFVFRNRRGDALKLLVWSSGGFILVYKKLERGRFRLGPITLTSGDPFGLFRIKYHLAHTSNVVVYPNTVALRSFPLPIGMLPGAAQHGG